MAQPKYRDCSSIRTFETVSKIMFVENSSEQDKKEMTMKADNGSRRRSDRNSYPNMLREDGRALLPYFREREKRNVFTKEEERKAFQEYEDLRDEMLAHIFSSEETQDVLALHHIFIAQQDEDEEKNVFVFQEIQNKNSLAWKYIRRTHVFLSNLLDLNSERERNHCLQKIRAETLHWFPLYERAEHVRAEIVSRNQRLVISLAGKFIRKSSLTFADLVQEGNIGLMIAVDKFELQRECKFSTMAVRWIQQAIRRSLTQKDRMIRIPGNLIEGLERFNRAEEAAMAHYGLLPSNSELAVQLGVDEERVADLRYARSLHFSSLDQAVRSAKFNDQDEDAMLLFMEDERAESPEASSIGRDMVDKAKTAARNMFSPEAYHILTLRGYFGDEQHTLQEIGDIIGISRERVRQITEGALGRLQNILPRTFDIFSAYQEKQKTE